MVCDAIESALRQSLPPFEIIVVDDGSMDDTASALKKYGNRISYQYQANRGVSAARNIGLSRATGDYIAFLDSDDLWDTRKLEVQVAVLKKLPEVHLLFTDFEIHKQDGIRIHAGTRRWFPFGVEYSDLYDYALSCRDLGIDIDRTDPHSKVYCGQVFDRMLHLPYGLLSSAIMRRDLVEDGLRYTEGVSMYEDWEFFARVAKSHVVGFLDSEMTFNRSHRGPERLSLGHGVSKSLCYLGVLERVWKADSDFVSRSGPALRKLEAEALLILAREGVLAGDDKTAHDALERWRSLDMSQGRAEAWIYEKCTSTLYGPFLLRYLLRARTLLRIIVGSTKKGKYSCAPS
jgi:glycosyltransferase involved in cell wall biosynthesis